MRRTEHLQNLYQAAVSQVTASSQAWSDFLAFSAQIYKYSFDNTLLIYLQRPDATMLAPLPLWNQLGRYVRKGEKSIAVCNFQEGDVHVQHLFDTTQTYGKPLPVIWNLDNIPIEQLVGQFYPNDVNDFYSCIYDQAHIAISSYMDMMLEGFERDTQHHFLGTLPLSGVEEQLHELLIVSIISIVHRRCNQPEDLEPDFSTISHFNTIPLISRLGFYMNTIAREILQNIARHVKIIENERSNTHDPRSKAYLQRNRWRIASQLENLESLNTAPTTFGQVRTDGAESSPQSLPAPISGTAHAGRPDEENERSRTGSSEQDGSPDGTTSKAPSNATDRRYARENTSFESDQGDSRRTDLERYRVQTKVDSIEPSQEPLESGSFFSTDDDLPESRSAEEMLEILLQRNQGEETIKSRIYQFVTEHHPTKPANLVPVLKNAYGIGGARGGLGQGLQGYMTSGKGIELLWTDANGEHEATLTWNKVASILLTLVREGRYSERFPPFPPEEPEWTLFSYAEQVEQSDQLNQHTEQLSSSDRVQNKWEPASSPVSDHSSPSSDSVSTVTAPVISVSTASNYRFDPSRPPYVSGPKSKYKHNVEAIQLLKQLETEQRQASPEEQQILAGYVGWGGLANAFHPTASGWEQEYTELKQLLDEDEYAAARSSTITAFYTEQAIIRPIHDTLKRFGLTDGTRRKLLEPSMGTGNFLSVLPPEWGKAELHGVELDSLTGRLARQLYPNANVRQQGFETVDWKNTRFDAMFSNIPFHNVRVFDKHYTSNYLIHDYFFIKSLDLLKPEGILAYIVSKGTLDKQDSSVRKLLAQQAELIGAIRLPNTTFQSLAGATVTTDIVFLQKRAVPIRFTNEEWPEWVEVGQTSDHLPLNRYYLSHPEKVIGRMVWDQGMYGPEQTTACVPLEGQDLIPALEQALHSLQATFPLPATSPSLLSTVLINITEPTRREAPHDAKNFTYIIEGTRIYYCENGELIFQDIQGKKAERIKGLCEIRMALLDVIDIQSQEEGYEDAELATAQSRLNKVYDRFVRSYGAINERANTSAFSDDDQLPLLRSIEDFTPQKTWVKAAIFTRPTIRPNRLPDRAESALEAMQICLNQRLRIDLPYIGYLCNKTTDEVREELGGRIYLNPQKYTGDIDEGWELDEEYLSGSVKNKLAYATLKAQEHPDLFTRNVEALTRVQPAPLLPGDIDFRIGSPWIPIRYYRDFMYKTFGTATVFQNNQTVNVDYLEYTNTWRVAGKSLERGSIKVNQTYGTPRINAYEIFENSLNLQSVTVRDPVTYLDAGGKEQVKYVINARETMIARAKQQQMREAFASWLFQDKERADTLLAIYNDKFNTIRPRHYDGEHLVFSGMSGEMELRKHQKDVAARILYSGTALMAHEVGAGKTAAMIAAGMALKRIGAAQKPMYCVPNHLTEQWANEFLRFYPGANILVTTKKDFTPANRQRFVSRIAMGNYDAIIIGHSQFEKIPISRERQERLLETEIRNVSHMIDQMKREKGDNWGIKQMVIFEKNLKSRLKRLVNEGKKDDLLTFEQLGVDMLFVDEAHAYKNCFTYTKMRNVAGIGKSSSQRATDMMLKCQYLQEMNNGRGIVFATGTPISNSMSEMYVMQRYLQPHLLRKLGLDFFDNWAATFGEVVTSLEMTPEGSGYRMKSRFAKFHNLPELMSLFRLVADIQTADMLNLPTPKLKDEKAAVVVSECSPYQRQIMDDFVIRAEKIRNNEVDASEDNMLKLTHEAKLMSIDPRLLDEDAPSDPHSKLNRCIGNVFDIWQQSHENRLTQVIFSDSGTPKPGQFNVYDEIKNQLVAQGLPEKEIAFIHDAKTDVQREQLFENVRRGSVRILLGSTVKMGTGTNVQDRLIAAHHLDCPWRPADITQRDGRILRQGNRNETVQIFRYVTKGTFDSYLWQIQEQKLRYISQVMTGKSISRSCEDADETVLTAAEVKAVATDNPLLAEKMHIDNEVARLKLLKANWQNEQTVLENSIQKSYPAMIAVCDEKQKKILTDIQTAEQNRLMSFSIQIDGKTYEERPEAGEILLLLANMTEAGQPEVQIGQYCGFPLSLSRSVFESVHLQIHGTETYSIELGESALGNLSRLENLISKFPVMLRDIEQKREDTLEQLAAAQKEIGKPFEEEQKLQQLVARQSEINSTLEFKGLQDQGTLIKDETETIMYDTDREIDNRSEEAL